MLVEWDDLGNPGSNVISDGNCFGYKGHRTVYMMLAGHQLGELIDLFRDNFYNMRRPNCDFGTVEFRLMKYVRETREASFCSEQHSDSNLIALEHLDLSPRTTQERHRSFMSAF